MKNGNCCGPRTGSMGVFGRELNQLLNEFMPEVEKTVCRDFSASLELVETKDSYEIWMDLPGVSAGQVDLEFKDGILTVSGERKPFDSEGERKVHRNERKFGAFSRSIKLPEVEGDKITAEFQNGVLKISAPKSPAMLARKIEIRDMSH